MYRIENLADNYSCVFPGRTSKHMKMSQSESLELKIPIFKYSILKLNKIESPKSFRAWELFSKSRIFANPHIFEKTHKFPSLLVQQIHYSYTAAIDLHNKSMEQF